MKALIRKDFYVLRKQLWLYALIIMAFQVMPNGTPSYISILYAALVPASAFAYDDRSQWDMIELMLPYSTRQIVLSRYCVGWISALSFMTLGGLTRLLLSLVFRQLYALPEFWELGNARTFLAEVALSLCFLALSMPVYFRFDAERSRAIRTLMVLLLCGLVGAGIGIMSIRNISFSDNIFEGGFEQSLLPEYLVAAVLTALSIPLSMAAWKRRHR